MKRYDAVVEVWADESGMPLRLRWRKREFKVIRVVELWLWTGCWWVAGKVQRRYYYRIEVEPASARGQLYQARTFEIYRKGQEWTLSLVLD